MCFFVLGMYVMIALMCRLWWVGVFDVFCVNVSFVLLGGGCSSFMNARGFGCVV